MKKRVLLTGASSYLGARVYFDLQHKFDLIGTFYGNKLTDSLVQLDLSRPESIVSVMDRYKPEMIVHCANFASARYIDGNEKNFEAVNFRATDLLVDQANSIGAKMIFISSFGAFVPDDNHYAKRKFESEKKSQQTKAGYLIIRPSLITGFSPNTSNDRPFNRILKCIDDGVKECEFDDRWKFRPTYIGHVSQIIEGVIKRNNWNQMLPVVVDKVVSQYLLAKAILNHFGIEVKPIDKGYDFPLVDVDREVLEAFALQPNSYEEMIEEIVDDINSRDRFKLDD